MDPTDIISVPDEYSCVDLDEYDKRILRFIQINGKASLRDIQKAIGDKLESGRYRPSVSNIRKRIDDLREKGVIKYYGALIECCKVGYTEMMLIFLKVKNTRTIDAIIKDLIEKIPMLNFVYHISGEYPVFCSVKCIEKTDEINIIEEIKKIKGIDELTFQTVLKRYKEDYRIKIPE